MLLEPAPAAAGTGCLCTPAAAAAPDAACSRLTGRQEIGSSDWRATGDGANHPRQWRAITEEKL